MKLKASIVVMSHLSDAEMEIQGTATMGASVAKEHIEFAKFVILALKGDLNLDIDADKMWVEFIKDIEFRLSPYITLEEISKFVDDEMKFTIAGCLSTNQKLEAIKYLIYKGKKADKHIGLKEAKQYVDSLIGLRIL